MPSSCKSLWVWEIPLHLKKQIEKAVIESKNEPWYNFAMHRGGWDFQKRIYILISLIKNKSVKEKKITYLFQQNGMDYHMCTRQCNMFSPLLTTGDFLWKIYIWIFFDWYEHKKHAHMPRNVFSAHLFLKTLCSIRLSLLFNCLYYSFLILDKVNMLVALLTPRLCIHLLYSLLQRI